MRKEDEVQKVLDQLGSLAPTEQDRPVSAKVMLSRINREIEQPAAQRNGVSFWDTLAAFLFAPSRRLAFTAVLVAMMFITGLTSPTFRAAASDFLGNFRVQKFAAISISPDQLAILEQVAQSGLTPGQLQFVDEPGEATAVDSLGEATRLTGVRQILTLPNQAQPSDIFVTDGGSALFTIDIESSKAILEMAGADPNLLPVELNEANIRIFVYSGIAQTWDDGTMLLQTQSPLVEYPEGIDPAPLGQALLQLLGLSEEEANRLSMQIDWTSTLVLPIPTNIGTFQEVTVQGVSGLFVSAIDGESGLVWQKEGNIFMLTSPGDLASLLELANELK
ncbi:MAG: hypothetical protein AAF490_02080 [Chloroflexota bacterium]